MLITFKTLLRHYAKWAPKKVDMKLGRQRKDYKGLVNIDFFSVIIVFLYKFVEEACECIIHKPPPVEFILIKSWSH